MPPGETRRQNDPPAPPVTVVGANAGVVMSEQAHESITIAAPVDACFATLLAYERYAEWAADIKEATVLERDAQGRGTRVHFRAAAMGRSVSYTLAYDYEGAPNRLGWVLEEGDLVRKLDGAYEMQPSSDDPTATDVDYTLEVDLVVPLPGFVKRRAESMILKAALPELKARIESVSA